jgi:hypothetical protein
MIDNDGDVIGDGGEDPDNCYQTIGWDGELREIRPMFSVDPLIVVSNIKKCMQEAVSRQPKLMDYKWKAGSSYGEYYSLGGHVHFGAKLGRSVSQLAKYFAPIGLALESRQEGLLRHAHGSYGQLTDYRNQVWGGEYRTLSSWITSPNVAKGILCLAKTVGQELVERKITEIGDVLNITDDYVNNFRLTKIREIALSLELTIQNMRLYPTYARYIKFIFSLIKAGKSWFPKGMDMKAAWGVRVKDKSKQFAFYS